MSGSGFSEATMRTKLSKLTMQQESIQTLSLWLIHHQRHNSDTIVQLWLKEMKMETNAARLVNLVYLANDVIQNSRKKAPEFMQKFFGVLEPAFRHCSRIPAPELDKAITKVLKVFNDRQIYNPDQIIRLENAALGKKQMTSVTPHSTSEAGPSNLPVYDPEAVTKTAEDLIFSLKQMVNPPSVDDQVKAELACFPEAVGTPSMIQYIKNEEQMNELLSHVNKAEPLARDYCKRLADEMMERRNMQKLIDSMLEHIKTTVDNHENLLKEVKRKEEKVKKDLVSVQKAHESLPDLSEMPIDAPLPSLENLFSVQ